MATNKRGFISFEIDHDEGTKTMLAGQAKLPDSPFDFKRLFQNCIRIDFSRVQTSMQAARSWNA